MPTRRVNRKTCAWERERAVITMRWALIFAAAFACIWAGTRWAGSAVHYAANAASDSNVPLYTVSGVVQDGVDDRFVPWATVTVSGTASTKFIQATADLHGRFSLDTFAQRQSLTVEADGYQARLIESDRNGGPWGGAMRST